MTLTPPTIPPPPRIPIQDQECLNCRFSRGISPNPLVKPPGCKLYCHFNPPPWPLILGPGWCSKWELDQYHVAYWEKQKKG